MGILSHIYRATVTVQLVTIFYILMSEENDITKDPLEKIGQFKDWVLDKKPIEPPSRSGHH